MNLYTAVLFVHAIAVLALTAALTMEAWTLMQLRRAARASEARPWTSGTRSIAIAAICSLVIIYATGAWLTESLRSWALAWPRLAVLEMEKSDLIAPSGGEKFGEILGLLVHGGHHLRPSRLVPDRCDPGAGTLHVGGGRGEVLLLRPFK